MKAESLSQVGRLFYEENGKIESKALTKETLVWLPE